jgi:hypothetical protein
MKLIVSAVRNCSHASRYVDLVGACDISVRARNTSAYVRPSVSSR